MRLLAVLVTLLLAPAAAEAARPRALLVECLQGPKQSERAAIFEGRMGARAGSERMQMRFRLHASGGAGWDAVEAPTLDAWVTSDAGVRAYIFTKRVENLMAPGAYRMVIDFRWLDADGQVIGRARARSRVCRQPDQRPDLRVVGLAGHAAGPGLAHYDVVVRNGGRAASPSTDLVLTVNGADLPAAALPALDPRRRVRVRVLGPRCAPGSTVTVHVDAGGAVEERDEADNVRALPCPPQAALESIGR